jgi:hypothetical protein
MAEKKSIYEEALLDVKKIQEALNANTKEILRSVAREEIDGLVKESLENEDLYEEEEVKDDESASDSDESDSDTESSDEVEAKGEEDDEEEVEVDTDSDESDDETIDAPEVGLDDEDDDQEMGMDADDALGGDEIDMTSASDDDVIAIYKKLSGEDEIEIVGDEVHLNISEPGEYIVKKGALGIGGSSAMDSDEMSMDDESDEMAIDNEMSMDSDEMSMDSDEISMDDESDDDEMMYEIAMDDDDMVSEEDEMMKEEDEEEEDVVEEKIKSGIGMSVGSHSNLPDIKTKGPGVKTESIAAKKVIAEGEAKYKKLLTEAATLKAENEEFRKALKKFRNMLVETVVFNSNLSYVTKLFMEHSTTKDEKKQIIKRFDDEVTNLKESKRLYKTIANELATRKPINESIENKIIKEVTTSSSKQLNEATAYVDPSTQRIKDLIKRVENKDKY